MKVQFPLGWLQPLALGAVVVAPKFWCIVSGEGNDPVIPGEGFTEYGMSSRQGRAGFPVYTRLCVAEDNVIGANVMRV